MSHSIIVQVGFGGASTSDYLHLDDEVRGLLDTATLGPADGVFNDISTYVRTVHIQRGANRNAPVLRYEASTAEIELNNQDRRFDPTNLSGPYVAGGVTQVTPMRVVRIFAEWGGMTRELFRGFADEWVVSYDGPNASFCKLLATDATKVLANRERTAVAGVGAGEDSGARIDRILDSADWSATDRNIFPGDTTLQATTLAGNVWTEMLLVQDTEFGELFVDQHGAVQYRNRQSIMTRQRSISAQATFGDEPATSIETTINYATNPSVETTITGWSGGGFANPPTVAQSSAQAMFGTDSLLGTWDDASGGDLPQIQYEATGLTSGAVYTVSVYAYVPTGSPNVALFVPGPDIWGTNTGTTVDAWVRLTWTGSVVGSTMLVQLWPFNSTTTAGQQVYLDGLQIEEGITATAYCDGDQANCEWDGTDHASMSRRLPELPYAELELSNDGDVLVNRATISRVGGTEQVADDSASQALNLIRTHTRNDLLMQTDAVAAEYATFLLHTAKDPELRFSAMSVKPHRAESSLFPQVLGRRLGDRIRILRRPPGGGTITREVFIRGIEHTMTYEGDWVTKWTLQSATKWSFLILDHTTLGLLDSNALAY